MQSSPGRKPPLRWDEIQLFVGLLRHPSLSQASGALGVDTSTLSRRLAALEERLGLPLFDRTARGLRITPAAVRLAEAARAMEAGAVAFEREAENFERSIEGVVSLSTVPGVAEGLIVPTLPRLRSRYSRILLDLDASSLVRDLTRREVDLAIRTSRPASGSLVSKRVYTGPPWPLGSRDYVRELGKLNDLAAARWVGGEVGSPLAFGERLGQPAPVLRSSHIPVLLGAATAGIGLVWAARHFGYTYGLAPVQVTPKLKKQLLTLPAIELWLVAHESYRKTPRIAAVWDFLEEEFENLARHARERDREEWV